MEFEELLNNNNIDNFIKPENFTEKISEFKNGLNLILDDFKKYFVLYKMYPENEEYQQQFSNATDNVKNVLAKFFTLSNDVQINIDDISKKLLVFDELINKERQKNKELKIKLGIIEHKHNASSEMISNYKDIYDIKYLRNWALGLSAILCIFTISRVYKKQGV